jgi:hypothetical protein
MRSSFVYEQATNGRDDLADIFAAPLPGVEEGRLVLVWRLPKELQPEKPERKVVVTDDVGAKPPGGTN